MFARTDFGLDDDDDSFDRSIENAVIKKSSKKSNPTLPVDDFVKVWVCVPFPVVDHLLIEKEQKNSISELDAVLEDHLKGRRLIPNVQVKVHRPSARTTDEIWKKSVWPAVIKEARKQGSKEREREREKTSLFRC